MTDRTREVREGAALVLLLLLLGCEGSAERTATRAKPEGPPAITVQGMETSPASSQPALVQAPELPALPAGIRYVDGPGVIERVRTTRAKGVVVNVWASWCGPCKAEVPMLLELQRSLGPDAIELLFVSVDAPDKADAALTFFGEQQMTGPALLAEPPLGEFKATLSPLWRGSLPASFLFDPTGKLRYFWGAQVFEHEMKPILTGFLAGQAIDGAANFKIRQGGTAPP